MERVEQSKDFIKYALEYFIDDTDFLKLVSKRVLELYKTAILVNYNKKRKDNKIPGADEQYDIAVGVFSKSAIELNQFIKLCYHQIDETELGELKESVCKFLESRWNYKAELSDNDIRTAWKDIISKFEINEYYNELFQLYYESLSDEAKTELSNLELNAEVEQAVLKGYLGSGYPYKQKEEYQADLLNAEKGHLFTINTFLGEISKATASVKNTLKNSDVYLQMDSHHRII